MASAARFERPVAIDGTDKKTIKKTDIIVTGNAKEKMLSVGADLVITPMATFISSRTTANGNIITDAAENMIPEDSIPAMPIVPKLGILPIGKSS